MSDDTRELNKADFGRAISAKQRRRIAKGRIEGGKDILALLRVAARHPGVLRENLAATP